MILNSEARKVLAFLGQLDVLTLLVAVDVLNDKIHPTTIEFAKMTVGTEKSYSFLNFVVDENKRFMAKANLMGEIQAYNLSKYDLTGEELSNKFRVLVG